MGYGLMSEWEFYGGGPPATIHSELRANSSKFGKTAYRYNAPSTWNALQKKMKLNVFIPLSDLKLCVADTLHYKCECV